MTHSKWCNADLKRKVFLRDLVFHAVVAYVVAYHTTNMA